MRPIKSLTALALSATLGASMLSTVVLSAAPAGAASSLPACPTSALSKASGTVNIDFWEAMTRANETALEGLVANYNSSQSKVHVNLVQQGGYDVTWSKWQAGLTTGGLPAMAMIGDSNLQGAVDSKSILPVQSCINATKYNTKTFLPRVLSYWKVGGVQQGLPFNVSAPIFYYNTQAFSKAGIAKPPATLPELIADAKILKSKGQGTMGLKLDAWHLEAWLATANQLFVNNGNGRQSRATSSVFNTSTGRSLFTQLKALVGSGNAGTNPANGASAYDNLLGIGAGKYSMTIDTSAALGTISQLLGSGQYPNVTLGVAPFPTLKANPQGATQAGGAALYISNKVPAAQQAAAWNFMSWLDSAENQATWSTETGYIPIRTDAASTSKVQTYRAANPGYKVPYTMLSTGVTDNATSGAVVGPYDQVRIAIANAENSMYTGGASPRTALSNASTTVNSIIAKYNSRI